MIGLVSGEFGLSLTAHKANRPNYLHRFSNQQTYSANTFAIPDNASLLTIE